MKLKVETRVRASSQVVAAVLTSPDDAPKWQRHLVRMEVVRGGPSQAGSLARLHYLEKGKAHVMQDELLEVDPGRRHKSRVSGNGLSAVVETTLAECDGETILTLAWQGRPDAWWARAVFPLFRPLLRRHLVGDLRALAQLVEERA